MNKNQKRIRVEWKKAAKRGETLTIKVPHRAYSAMCIDGKPVESAFVNRGF